MKGRTAVSITLSEEERAFLKTQFRNPEASRFLSDRCLIILKCSEGHSNKEVAEQLGHSQHTVGKWRNRFAQDRIKGLFDRVS